MLAFLGGTGPEGRGLALRYALAGEEVVIGSRDAGRAQAVAEELRQLAPGASIVGAENMEAARNGDVVFLTFPYEAQRSLLAGIMEELDGKTVVNVVAPLVFEKGVARAVSVEGGSAAEESQALLPRSRVVGAFQNLSARKLLATDQPLEGDAVVCSDDAEAKAEVMALVEVVKELRSVDGGPLECARYVEALTALLLNINRRYKAQATIKVMGI
jgi:NADPH-dependent F420 reductase